MQKMKKYCIVYQRKKRKDSYLNSWEDYFMAEKIKLFKVFKDPAPKVTNVVTEEVTPDSKLKLNLAIKDKNFFEDKEVVDFLLDNTK